MAILGHVFGISTVFELRELGDPNHLEAVLRMIKTIDSVYDAYRVVPGGKKNADQAS